MESARKKVGVLTLYHDNTNFGATLQAYALQKKIIEQGYDAWVVDFFSEPASLKQRLLRLIFHPWRLPGVIGRRFKAMFSVKKLVEKEWDKLWERKYEKWEKFCRQNINVTEPVFETKLSQYMKHFDIMVTGSDQVWNPERCTESHFLPFKKEVGRRKVAYAASISLPSLTEEQKEIFRKWLPDFDFITVRENEGKQLLESFLDVKVEVVLDPTLLLTPDEWNKIAESLILKNQVSYRKINERTQSKEKGYVLFAALGTEPSHRTFVARVAERIGMRLLILSTTLVEMKANYYLEGDELVDVSPGQYLSLVRDASLVITDSFHCMAFSINFHRPFFVLKRDPDGQAHNMNSRLYTLLGALGLEDQLVGPDDADRVQLRDDLYDGVDEKLDSLRERSEKILSQMLNNEKGEELMQ